MSIEHAYSEEQPDEDTQGPGQFEAIQRLISTLEGRIDSLEESVAERDRRIAELEGTIQRQASRVNELDARTDMLQLVECSDSLDGRQRSIALIQHLKKAAEKKRKRGNKAHASVNREQAEEALHHPDVDRTTIYTDMKRAARLVGDNTVLSYESTTGGGSRLELNLENGELPASVGPSTKPREV